MRICLVVQFRACPDMDRQEADVSVIIKIIQRLSRGKIETAFRSRNGRQFGWFFQTDCPEQVQTAIERSPAFRKGDAMLVIEDEGEELKAGLQAGETQGNLASIPSGSAAIRCR